MNRAIPSMTIASQTSQRSALLMPRNVLSLRRSFTNDPIVDEILEEFQHLGFAGLRIDLEFFANLCTHQGDGLWSFNQFPNTRRYRIEAVITSRGNAHHYHFFRAADWGVENIVIATQLRAQPD